VIEFFEWFVATIELMFEGALLVELACCLAKTRGSMFDCTTLFSNSLSNGLALLLYELWAYERPEEEAVSWTIFEVFWV